MAEEEKAAAFARSLSCIEHLLAIQTGTQAELKGEQVDVVRFHQLREQLPAVESDREVRLDDLGPGLRYRLAMDHRTLTVATLADVWSD